MRGISNSRFSFYSVCPDDDALCELAIRESNKNQCYQYEISTLCCNRCKSLRDNTKADSKCIDKLCTWVYISYIIPRYTSLFV